VLNFQPSVFIGATNTSVAFSATASQAGKTGLSRIGTWTPEREFQECKQCGCSPVYNTADNSIPKYKPDPK
jgi:hypothetical protein